MIKYDFDTISAIATPFGTGGVGIIRISGNNAFEIINDIFSKKIDIAGKMYFGWILDNGKKFDEVVVLAFKAPHSYTGEDVIEIQAHGGIQNLKTILDLTLKHGARLAERGEFTKRAFLNKKLDLSQPESVLDIIHAKTSKFAQQSAKNLAGNLSLEISKIRKKIFDLLSKIVASIDFAEDVKDVPYSEIISELEKYINDIDKILDNAKSSNIMRQGIKIAILGRPNVGKSSLFNNLLNQNRAIVTEIAGTTRDVIQETIEIDGISATLIDTAGIRETGIEDKVEKIGIDFSKQTISDADLILFLYDGSQGMTKEDEEIFSLIKDKLYIKIATKSDLISHQVTDSLFISNVTFENMDLLKNKIKDKLQLEDFTELEFTTNQRQQECLDNAKKSLMIALSAAKENQLQDLITIDIKAALLALDEVTGEVITDDILNNIFENFCIGK